MYKYLILQSSLVTTHTYIAVPRSQELLERALLFCDIHCNEYEQQVLAFLVEYMFYVKDRYVEEENDYAVENIDITKWFASYRPKGI